MAGNMRVSILLDFIKKGRGARDARDDLKGLKQEATGLKAVGGADRLNRSLVETSSKARKLAGDLARAKTEAKALGATDARPKVSPYNRLKEMARPKARIAEAMASGGGSGSMAAAGAAGAVVRGLGSGAALGAVGGGAAAFALAAKAVNISKTLETSQKELAITTDATDRTVAKATEGFRGQTSALGETAQQMIKTSQLFAAAGYDFQTAIGAAIPSVRTAKASFADVADVAQAGIAAMQNLEVPVHQLGDAYDRMAQSAKLGQVEMKNLASELPQAAASYAKIGDKGLEGISDLTAQMQILRRETSSPAEASNRLNNLYEKITAEETVKNFKEQGVNLQKEIEKGEKRGITPLKTTLSLLDRIVRKKDGTIDAFKMNAVFGDMQARQAATSLLKNKADLDEMRTKISTSSKGVIDKDFKRAGDRAEAEFSRLEAAWDTLLGRMGEAVSPLARKLATLIAGPINTANAALTTMAERSEKAVELAEAARRIAEGNAKPGDTETVAKDPDGVRKVAQAKVEASREDARQRSDGHFRPDDTPLSEDAASQSYNEEIKKNLEAQLKVLDAAAAVGKLTYQQRETQTRIRARLKDWIEAPAPETRVPADQVERGRSAQSETDARKVEESQIERLKMLRDLGDARAADKLNKPALDERGEGGLSRDIRPSTGIPAKVPTPPVRPADLRAQSETDARKDEDPQIERLKMLRDLGDRRAADKLNKPALDERGEGGLSRDIRPSAGAPAKVPTPPVRPADLRAQFEVDLQPAIESQMLKYADTIRAGQVGAEAAAQQVGEGVKGKLAAVDAGAAGQQAMVSFAQGITAGGAQAVAAAQRVAAQVQSALAVKVAGGASVRSRTSGALHDGVG